ncbi:hypothetical protein [Kitasatospora phosalacinea]|uniref:hypothetical protein n=1 Tax=Kitasatospora phosalacinea TaxID=2065 RepID=UPI0005279EFB|nr:hypothetical protein [Kitasatospora phosalacinea]
MPHPRRPSVRLLTRRRLDRRQDAHHRRGRGARCNPLRRGVDRARRRAVALACCALGAAVAAGAAAWLFPARLLPVELAPAPYGVAGRALSGVLVFGAVAGGAAVGLRRRLRGLERRAADSWERGWRRVEPLWSGRALPWSDGSGDGNDGGGGGG